MSLQAALWNRRLFLDLISPDMSPWDVEAHINPPEGYRVIGTRQYPVRYANGLYKGDVDKNQLLSIEQPHRDVVEGMIPEGIGYTEDGLPKVARI
jgi:hypothetical protein